MLYASNGGVVFVNEQIIKGSQLSRVGEREERRAKREKRRDKQEDFLMYAALSPAN